MTRMVTILTLIVLLLSLALSCDSFAPGTKIRRSDHELMPTSPLLLSATSTTTSTRALEYSIKQVLTDDRVLDVASFRNNITNPTMMVERQQAKQDAVDKTASALNGLKIGLLFIGPPAAIYTWYSTGSIQDGLSIYATLGGTAGIMLGLNNYLGKGIYVPTVAEATNRILVDYAEGLKRRQDVGFVALCENDYTNKFAPCNNVMACADAQLRNSPQSPSGTRPVQGLPPHLHIKNMLVDKEQRRQGIGNALIAAFEQYARNETDAQLLTLEVEDDNVAAVRLYEAAGFETATNPTPFTKRTFMIKSLLK